MKKIITLILLTAMLLTVCIPFAAAEGESVSVVLRHANFIFDGVEAQSETDTAEGDYSLIQYFTDGGFSQFKENKHVPNATTKRMYARVYIPEDGNYKIWAILKTFVGNEEGKRWIDIKVDDSSKFLRFGTKGAETLGYTGWMWEDSEPAALDTGWHTIEIAKVNKGKSRLAAVMITNDTSLDPNSMTAAELAPLQDTEAPAFTGELSLVSDYTDTVTVTCPEIVGAVESAVNVKVNDADPYVAVPDTENKVTVSGLKEGDSVTVTVSAVDMCGNSAETKKTITFTTVVPEPPVETAIILRPDNFHTEGINEADYDTYMYEYNYSNADSLVTNQNYKLSRYFADGHFIHFAKASMSPNGTTKRMYADFYLPSADDYSIWAMVKTFNDNAEGERFVRLAIDNEIQNYKYCTNGADSSTEWIEGIGSDHTGWRWEEDPVSVWLENGWHTVDVAAVSAELTRFAAVLITNKDCDPNDMTLEELAALQDLQAPSFGESELSLAKNDSQSIVASWQAAADNSAVKNYYVYVNDAEPVELGSDVQSYIINGLKLLDEVSVSVEAKDTYGNITKLAEKNLIFSDINLTECIFLDKNGEASQSVENIISGNSEIKTVFKLKNISESSKTVLLGVAVYDKATGSMVMSTRKNCTLSADAEVSETVSVQLIEEVEASPENYNIYAALWDTADNIAPQATGVLLVGGEE